jgi:hypothetical protein
MFFAKQSHQVIVFFLFGKTSFNFQDFFFIVLGCLTSGSVNRESFAKGSGTSQSVDCPKTATSLSGRESSRPYEINPETS